MSSKNKGEADSTLPWGSVKQFGNYLFYLFKMKHDKTWKFVDLWNVRASGNLKILNEIIPKSTENIWLLAL